MSYPKSEPARRNIHLPSPTPGSVDRGCHKILSRLKVSDGFQRPRLEEMEHNVYTVPTGRCRCRAEVVIARTEQALAPHKLATVHQLRDQIGPLHQRLVGTSAGGKMPTRIDTFLKIHGWSPPGQPIRVKKYDGEMQGRSALTGKPPLQRGGIQS